MRNKKRISAAVMIVCLAAAFFIGTNIRRESVGEKSRIQTASKILTEMALPMAMATTVPQETVVKEMEPSQSESDSVPEAVDHAVGEVDKSSEETFSEDVSVTVKDSVDSPQVLIYHTHTTESYRPVTQGNFHSVAKEGTVRQVGDALALRLEELGYSVIHDETIHDNPSYNQSYARSLETAKGYLDKYPGIVMVVDLHRDAAGYAGSVGKVISVDGKNVASYGYVVGQGNPNVGALNQTVKDLNRIAGDLYPGFTGKLIEKEYKFNQYISDHHILLEVGNNENTIEQTQLTGRYLGDVIGAYLKERGIE